MRPGARPPSTSRAARRPRVRSTTIDTAFAAVKPLWSTSSFGEGTDTTATELSALGAHLALCRGRAGRLFSLQCLGEDMHGFVAPRVVTTLVVVAALLIGVTSLAS